MNRLQKVSTRMGPDLRDAIEAMPGLGSIALWVKFLDSPDPGLIARTDGAYVEAGPRYSSFDDSERRFILLHELLHVALAHPARAREMEKRLPDFNRNLHNIAADAIINSALSGVNRIRMPAKSVTLEKVLTLIGLWNQGDSQASILRRWSSEALYHAMTASGKVKEILALGSKSDPDLVPIPGSPGGRLAKEGEVTSIEETLHTWESRLAIARGSLGMIFNRLLLELPKVRTPWERVLRGLLFQYTRRKYRSDPTRPSRRWLALEGELRSRERVELPFERGRRLSPTGRIALAVDTSGSITGPLLTRFAAEVAAVLDQTDPLLRLIVSDNAVHEVRDFKGREGAKFLRGFNFKGGGGTDFRPAIRFASEWRPDLLIYLTDLEGEAGEAPRFPVLWAVPEGRARAPWGKIIELV